MIRCGSQLSFVLTLPPVTMRTARQERKREDAAFAAKLRAQGLAPLDVFRALTRRDLDHMEAQGRERGRCFRCWHSLREGTCICAALSPVPRVVCRPVRSTTSFPSIFILHISAS